jgi:hypothetical protein
MEDTFGLLFCGFATKKQPKSYMHNWDYLSQQVSPVLCAAYARQKTHVGACHSFVVGFVGCL